MTSTEHLGSIDKISVKVPPFWADDPVLWFAQIENQFDLAGIKHDSTRFYHVASALEQRYATAVRDIVLKPPDTGKYLHLKTELIRRFTPSPAARLKRLFQHEELGDRKPSDFLFYLRTLAENDISPKVLRTLWLERLPARMHDILAASPPYDLDALGIIADRIHEELINPPRVAIIDNSFQTQIEELSRQVAALSGNQRATSARSTTTLQDVKQDSSTTGLCWYHQKYGTQARRCRQPCNFEAKNSKGSL
jgi:cleavage and polyadenylation specificity factor subunit 1